MKIQEQEKYRKSTMAATTYEITMRNKTRKMKP